MRILGSWRGRGGWDSVSQGRSIRLGIRRRLCLWCSCMIAVRVGGAAEQCVLGACVCLVDGVRVIHNLSNCSVLKQAQHFRVRRLKNPCVGEWCVTTSI